ncbi:MAG: phenylacetate--CoA ligase [Candidatus Thermoplasmatota archaeon]|nr:phenylacetate--CoA ligase [Candidatus Thermoplasmatota archaeon]MDD5778386.1 phenylacetate--CoA ligase [Candidatus Thermoplasmatota archaeon]
MDFWSPDIEAMPLDELKELQLRRLQKTVRRAYDTNEAYHRLFKEAGVAPGDIRSLDDLARLPFLTKDDLRHYYPFGLLCVETDDCVELHASSGTTGTPVVGPYTRGDVEVWTEVMARALWANGMRQSDVLQNAYGYGLFTGAHGFEKGAQRIGALVVPIGSGNTRRQITLMKDFGTTALSCTPSYSLYMAEVAREMGFDPREDFRLRLGLFGAEAWSDEMRAKIEEEWGIVAHEHYGLTEIIGPGVVTECSHKRLHVNADHFVTEIIDPQTGEQLPPGEEGELVFTTVTKEAFPAIRFRTGDIARYSEEPCACGRTLPVQSRIKGRSDDMMKIKGVIVFPSQIEAAIMAVEGTSGNYQLVKRKQREMTSLSIKIEPTEERHAQGHLDDLAQKIEEEVYAVLNLHIPVEVVPPNTIPRSLGKAKRVVEE